MKNVKQDGKLAPDDPRLTAYAFGELEREERDAIEAQLVHDADARATVAAVRAMAKDLTEALANENDVAARLSSASTATSPVSLHRAAIVSGSDRSKLDGGKYVFDGKFIRFPQFYYVVSGLAAACFVLFVATRPPAPPRPAPVAPKHYTVIDLGASAPAPENANQGSAGTSGPGSPATPLDLQTGPKLAGEIPIVSTNVPAETQLKPTLLEQVKSELAETKASQPAPAQKSPSIADAGPPTSASAARGITPSRPSEPPAAAPAVERKFVVQSASVKPGANSGGAAGIALKEEVVVLSPFSVSTSRDAGYASANTLAGSRVNARGAVDLLAPPRGARFGIDTESYASAPDNNFLRVKDHPLSTFSIDNDTASYSNVRRFLSLKQRPPRDAVRIEEMLNYFPYRYAAPLRDESPFAAALEVASAPWAPEHRLVRIGVKGREVSTAGRAAANLVFLLDVSGSMNAPNRLPLVKESLHLLVEKLRPDDRVAIVTYAGNSGLALPSTPAAEKREILAALDELRPGGSTNGAMGIQLAYDIARANFVSDGINRVILCTDGDFNVGVQSEGDLVRLIENKAKTGVFLTVLGFGVGNLKDSMLEKLADKGNGSYGYIDTRREAEKIFVEQVNGTLVTIAKDVKLQVEFNPAKVASYRLIGYEKPFAEKRGFQQRPD